MNEMMFTGYFYMPTMANTNEGALADLLHRAREIGLNIDNISSIIVRDKDGEDITQMQQF